MCIYIFLDNKSYGMFWIAMATYLSFYPLMLAIPTTFMFINNAKLKGKNLKVHHKSIFIYLFII